MKKHAVYITLAAFLLLACCSCAGKNLSEEETEALREDYPYADSGLLCFTNSLTLDIAADKLCAIVVAEVSDECYIRSTASPLYPNAAEWVYLPVSVESLIYNNGGISEGDELNLYFGTTSYFANYYTYPVGGKFVFLLTAADSSRGYAFDDLVYITSIDRSAYVTDGDYIMSVTRQPLLSDYDGYTLKSFEKGINAALKEAKK